MKKADLSSGLKQMIDGLAVSYGLELNSGCRELLEELVDAGVSKISKGDSASFTESESSLTISFNSGEISDSKALRVQQDFAFIMFEIARISLKHNSSSMGENHFAEAKSALCPMPPWFPEPCS